MVHIFHDSERDVSARWGGGGVGSSKMAPSKCSVIRQSSTDTASFNGNTPMNHLLQGLHNFYEVGFLILHCFLQ